MRKLGTVVVAVLVTATSIACSSSDDVRSSAPRPGVSAMALLKEACAVNIVTAGVRPLYADAAPMDAGSGGGGDAGYGLDAADEVDSGTGVDAGDADIATAPCGCVNPITGEPQDCPVTPPMPPPPPPPPTCEPEQSGDPGSAVAIIDLPQKIAPLAMFNYGSCGDPVDTCAVDPATGASQSGAPYLHMVTDEVYVGQIVVDGSGTKRLALHSPAAEGTQMLLVGAPVPLVHGDNTFADHTNPVTVAGETLFTVIQVDTRPVGSNCVTNRC